MTKKKGGGGGRKKGAPRAGVPAISGKGAYSIKELTSKMDGLLKRIPRGAFSAVGSRFGPLGGLAGHAISKISGYGSYKVGRNTLGTDTVIGPEAQNIPTFSPSEHGSRVRHREFISNVIVPDDPGLFNNSIYRLGVDNVNLFPWLSRLAARYQKYKVHGMVFYYKSTSTDYNNSGMVGIAVNYNAAEEGYQNSDQLLNSMFAVASKPSDSFAAPVECDPGQMPEGGYYVRHEASLGVGSTTDLRLSSIGSLNLVTEGLTLPTNTVIGQLWCTYDVELLFPYVTVNPAEEILSQTFCTKIQNYNITNTTTSNGVALANVLNLEAQNMGSPFRFEAVQDPQAIILGSTAFVDLKITWTDVPQLVGQTFFINNIRINRGSTVSNFKPVDAASASQLEGATIGSSANNIVAGGPTQVNRKSFQITEKTGSFKYVNDVMWNVVDFVPNGLWQIGISK
jgi:hypothetical protein